VISIQLFALNIMISTNIILQPNIAQKFGKFF
jgi:hypothetical protein